MSNVLPLVYGPDKMLNTKCDNVENIDGLLIELARKMVNTMINAGGIGLACPQVGKAIRMFIMWIDEEKDSMPTIVINPMIIAKSEKRSSFEEGCLSFPGQTHEIYRPAEIEVKYFDQNQKEIIRGYDGLYATCFQHEFDHINGVTIIDHINNKRQKKEAIEKAMAFKAEMEASGC